MTDEALSDCSNSACAIGLVMIIFHLQLQIFWPSFAFWKKKKKKKKGGGGGGGWGLSYLQLAALSGSHLDMLLQEPVLFLQHSEKCL